MVQGILLRRTKSSTINGEPIISLPPRTEELVKQPFSQEERDFYASIQKETHEKLQSMKEVRSVRHGTA